MSAITNAARDIAPDVDRAAVGAALANVILKGDLSKLSDAERVTHYNAVCASSGLNPLTRPFEYIMLNGKLVLYARKDATDQLRALYRISVQVVRQDMDAGLVMVTARATTPDGRQDEDFGAVPLPASGEARANALMKAMTKAKRRVTLSICGLGFLDESEIESIPADPRSVVGVVMPERPALAAPSIAAMQAAADKPLPIYSPDGVLHMIGPNNGQPAVMVWMKAARKAIAKLGTWDDVRGWLDAMAPHFAEIEATEPEAVEAVRNMANNALAQVTPSDDPDTQENVE